MSSKNNLIFNRPTRFNSTLIQDLVQSPSILGATRSSFASSSISVKAKFDYSPETSGMKSSQQIKTDFSKFQNHVFFNSAEVATNIAFEKIGNGFPFDGTKEDYQKFFDGLSGYENYVFEQMPKSKNYLYFSGSTNGGSNGTFLSVNDYAGSTDVFISKNVTGEGILDPKQKSMTTEFYLFLPSQTNDTQNILQKSAIQVNGTYQGFTCWLLPTASISQANVRFACYSGMNDLYVDIPVTKGTFNHVAVVWNREPLYNKLYGYLNSQLVSSSSTVYSFSNFNFATASLLIGSGSTFGYSQGTVEFQNTLSGALDELRIYHKAKSQDDIKQYQNKNVYADSNLKLYYKFNEPSGSQSSLVLDSSGNSLHTNISNFATVNAVRDVGQQKVGLPTPVVYEKSLLNPNLFGTHPDFIILNTQLLSSASVYDEFNPNLITRLIPKHYLLQGQHTSALTNLNGPLVDGYTVSGPFRGGELGTSQPMLYLLYTWAQFFDEIKIFIDSFSNLYSVDYDSDDTVPDNMLPWLAEQYGLDLRNLFDDANIAQYVEGENLELDISNNEMSLRNIQNQLWRRLLTNLQDIIKSKGTLHSVKSLIRSFGIDPDSNFRIREYGGPVVRSITDSRDSKTEVSAMLSFEGESSGSVKTPLLSGSRTEPGYPYASGVPSTDGLFLSGSWTVEATYKHLTSSVQPYQSLGRMVSTSSLGEITTTNIVLEYNDEPLLCNLHLFTRTTSNTGSVITLPNVPVTDGARWNISFGRYRSDDPAIAPYNTPVSSSWFLRAATQNQGSLVGTYLTSSFINDRSATNYNETSGSLFIIGSSSINTALTYGLNDPSVNSVARTINYSSKFSDFRVWTKGLSETEWLEHVRNYKSLGVSNSEVNFNFVTALSGSFQKLRIDAPTKQTIITTDITGGLSVFDYSQNNLSLIGSGFTPLKQIINPETIYFSYLSPKFDEFSSNEKVRARSFLNEENIDINNGSYASVAPVYEIPKNEQPTDNVKFSIDFSVVDALDQDIVKIFSSLDQFDNYIGNPNLLFGSDYPDLEFLQDVYFHRLTEKMNVKGFFEFYKWFDMKIGTIITQLLPRKTNYLGTNFVVEQHMLERAKMEYYYSDIYQGPQNRINETILIRQLVGKINRF